MSDLIERFSGDHEFLSNFHRLSIPLSWHGLLCPTVEHAFQAAKANSPDMAARIARAPSARAAKELGRVCKMRPGWDQMRFGIMFELVNQKFRSTRRLSTDLLSTGTARLVEGNNWHDNTWGECWCANCLDEVGHNWLGRILMQVRRELAHG